jgi:hypothetical protein
MLSLFLFLDIIWPLLHWLLSFTGHVEEVSNTLSSDSVFLLLSFERSLF